MNRATGAFEPTSGRGILITTGVVTKSNMFKWNGPKWLTMASGDQLIYSYNLPNRPHDAAHTRMAVAVQNRDGEWVSEPLSPELPRMSHVASSDKGDQNPHIRYLDPSIAHLHVIAISVSQCAQCARFPPPPQDGDVWDREIDAGGHGRPIRPQG